MSSGMLKDYSYDHNYFVLKLHMLKCRRMAMVNVNKLQYFCVGPSRFIIFYFYRATTHLLGKEVHSCLVGRNRGLPLLVLWYESQLFCSLMKLRQPLIHQVSPKSKRPWIRWEIVTFYSISVGVSVEGVFNITKLKSSSSMIVAFMNFVFW